MKVCVRDISNLILLSPHDPIEGNNEKIDHQGLEERGELPLLFGGFILGHSSLQSKYITVSGNIN